MICLSPVSIARVNGKNAADRVSVPCGQCLACLQNRRGSWSFRLNQELRDSKSGYFITLTYDNDNLPLKRTLENGETVIEKLKSSEWLNENPWVKVVPTIYKIDVQLFLKRLRKTLSKMDTPPHIKYFIAGEYGSDTHRPHYHGIFFNLPYENKTVSGSMKLKKLIFDAWNMGEIDIGEASPASIHYVSGYIMSKDTVPIGAELPFSLMSKNPAIGIGYMKNYRYHLNKKTYETVQNGNKTKLPRYYIDKIFGVSDKIDISEKNKLLSDEKIEKFESQLINSGINPHHYKHELLKQKIEKIKKTITKTKKL